MNKYKTLVVPMKIYEQYKREVKGNENATLIEVEKKLTRNMKMSDRYPAHNDPRATYCVYGSLHFIVSRTGVVTHLRNRCHNPKWKKKEYLKVNLDRVMKIN